MPLRYLYDHLHFTTEGYLIIAKQVAEALFDAAEMLSPK
jgi:lysophospholipase L1-like esterase